MGNCQEKETEELIKERVFQLYCEQEHTTKTVTVTEDGLEFYMGGEVITIPYISITSVKHYKMMSCGCKRYICITVSSGRYYYFSGKNVIKFNEALTDELPEVEILL